MTHFVYVLGTGSRWQNNELRYSLRSLNQNFQDEYDVWIVGHLPPWTCKATHIACVDIGNNPIVNVSHKLLFAIETLPPEFVLMNDDFYIMRKIDEIPLIHGGLMITGLTNGTGIYADAFRKTYSWLKSRIKDPVRYDRHVPFPVRRDSIKNLRVGWAAGSFLLKTLFGNLIHGGAGSCLPYDVKSVLPANEAVFWSTNSDVMPDAKKKLLRMFPDKSPNEV